MARKKNWGGRPYPFSPRKRIYLRDAKGRFRVKYGHTPKGARREYAGRLLQFKHVRKAKLKEYEPILRAERRSRNRDWGFPSDFQVRAPRVRRTATSFSR